MGSEESLVLAPLPSLAGAVYGTPIYTNHKHIMTSGRGLPDYSSLPQGGSAMGPSTDMTTPFPHDNGLWILTQTANNLEYNQNHKLELTGLRVLIITLADHAFGRDRHSPSEKCKSTKRPMQREFTGLPSMKIPPVMASAARFHHISSGARAKNRPMPQTENSPGTRCDHMGSEGGPKEHAG